jgi:hypothetical protein
MPSAYHFCPLCVFYFRESPELLDPFWGLPLVCLGDDRFLDPSSIPLPLLPGIHLLGHLDAAVGNPTYHCWGERTAGSSSERRNHPLAAEYQVHPRDRLRITTPHRRGDTSEQIVGPFSKQSLANP